MGSSTAAFLYLALGPQAHVCKIRSVPLAPCQNFHSKPSDRVEPHQPVTEAGVSLGLPLSVRPPRRAQELKHMCKLNRHPNSLPYTKQFKWYSLERWQVLMSLSVLLRQEERDWKTETRDGRLFTPHPPSVFLVTHFHWQWGKVLIRTLHLR